MNGATTLTNGALPQDAFSAQDIARAHDAVDDVVNGRNQRFKDEEVKEVPRGGGFHQHRAPGIEYELIANTEPQSVGTERKIRGFVSHDPRFEAIAEHPELLSAVRRCLLSVSHVPMPVSKEEVTLFQDMALLKPAGGGREKPWHQDQAYFDLEEGSRCVGVWIAMDAADTSNGCMRLLRGRHRDGDGQPVVQAHHQERDWQIADVRPTPSCSALDCSLGSHARAAGRMTRCCRATSRRCRSSPARSSSLTRSCRTALRPTRTRMAGGDEHCSFTTCSGRRRRSPRSACRRSGGWSDSARRRQAEGAECCASAVPAG